MAECANESLGMEIKNINIQEYTQTNEYVAVGTPDKEYKSGINLSAKNDSITSVVLTQEEKISLRHARKIAAKKTPPPP